MELWEVEVHGAVGERREDQPLEEKGRTYLSLSLQCSTQYPVHCSSSKNSWWKKERMSGYAWILYKMSIF